MVKLSSLPPSERTAFAPFLRGANFARLADSLLNDDPAPILAKYGIKLDVKALKQVAYIVSLPSIVVTPPEEGNRMAQRGEKGGKGLRVEKGKLRLPERRSRAERQARRERREARARKAKV